MPAKTDHAHVGAGVAAREAKEVLLSRQECQRPAPVFEGFPLRYGVALPAGNVFGDVAPRVRFRDGSSSQAQARAVMTWPDGSARFLLLDWLAQPDDPGQAILWDANAAADDWPVDAATMLRVEQSEDEGIAVGDHQRTWLSIAGLPGPARALEMTWLGAPLDLAIQLDDGAQLAPTLEDAQVVDRGPLRASLLLQGRFRHASESTNRLVWQLHVHLHAGTRSSSWQLTLRNPRAASHPGGIWELGDPASASIAAVSLRLSWGDAQGVGEPAPLFSAGVGVPWRDASRRVMITQLGSAADGKRSNNHLLADGSFPSAPYRGYRLEADGRVEHGDRATPAMLLRGRDDHVIGITAAKFWQNFPVAMQADRDRLQLDLWPRQCPWVMELQPGEQKTYTFHLCGGTSAKAQAMSDGWRSPPRVQIDPAWTCDTGVLPWLLPRDQDRSDRYLRRVDAAIQGPDNFFVKRQTIDQYGWRNFGDVWGDHEAVHSDPEFPFASHYNNQYDLVLGLGLNYLRGGDGRWLELMEDLARHTIDIDIYHTDDDRPAYNHGMFWHTVHYVDAGRSTHRTYPRGTCGGGPSSGHAYSRGLLLHYCLTGDETARQAVIRMGDWMIAAEDGRGTRYRFLADGETGLTSASGSEEYHGPGRGPGNAIEVLVTAFELTHDRKYLGQAERIIRRVVHPHQDPAALDLLDAENKWFYNLFLQALGRYLEVKITCRQIDRMYAYAQRVLLRFAAWMALYEHPYLDRPEKLEFPTETWAAQEMRKVEVFQWAARHAMGQARRRYLERAEFFFRTSLDQLDGFGDRARLCRPIALLMSSGYSHAWFTEVGLESIEPAPEADDYDFGRPQKFVSQKKRAIRNAKLLVGLGGSVGIAAVAGGLWWMWRG